MESTQDNPKKKRRNPYMGGGSITDLVVLAGALGGLIYVWKNRSTLLHS